ncbi:MAG: 4-hydroxythreonine-4-phosphate dehydrogenase PdxA [Rhizobiaceae bacterium]
MSKPAPSITSSLPIAITIGEPAGIGADVILALWQERLKGEALPPFYLLCDPVHLAERSKLLGYNFSFQEYTSHSEWAEIVRHGEFPVWPLKNTFKGRPGKAHKEDAAGVVEAISTGVEQIQAGMARAIVTLPINKKSLYNSGFDFAGHTEFLGALSEEWPQALPPVKPVMMLAGPALRAVPVTIHIALKDVPAALTTNSIIETVTIAERDLRKRFGIEKPRIAVSGLNPHAGEEGAMGMEDIEIIAPAIKSLQSKGINCFGPLPADTMFHKAARERYDLAVCMYHDQALIPAKALAFDETVNVTLGLPFVRTSPDHGTAYDIAGLGTANPSSTLAALRMADEMST